MAESRGKKFREALRLESPLQVVGTINALAAIMAKETGFRALYLSGAGVANSSYGLPDLGITTLDNVFEDAGRITAAVELPLLVDIDTGWGNALMIEKAIKQLERIGVAGVHIEDQVFEKKCGHLPGKKIVPKDEMCARIQAAAAARSDPDFVIMARTDAFANEGMEGVISRSIAYREAGADMLFPEAISDLSHYRRIREAAGIPILANITEFGKTPLFTVKELKEASVDIILYPLSANRAMNQAALEVFRTIRERGTQKSMLEKMQTREELYKFLRYEDYEKKLTQKEKANG
jgi:methylisocitrate lyase